MAHGVDVRRTVVFITCVVMVSGGVIKSSTSEEMPVRPWCSAPTVVEGQTGAVTFFLGKDILSSESIFAILNRANEPNIVVCHQTSKLTCRVSTTLYEVDGFINDSLTLQIPNVTKDFEGAYMLQVYANGSPQPLSNCTLLVKVNPEVERCIAPLVTEGQTGTVTFFIRPDILASDDFFATLRRTKYPMKDILVCDRQSPVKCTTTNPIYKSNGIVNHSLTLLIPSVTQDFEDAYSLQVYARSQPGPTESCPLHIKAKSRGDLQDQSCLAPLVIEGQTGTITFFIRPEFLSSDDFFATLRRGNNPEKDILVCDRQSPIKCLVTDKLYQTEGIVNYHLTLLIPNVTQEFMDTYYLQVYTNGSPTSTNPCAMSVIATNVGKSTADSRIEMYELILILFAVVILLLILLLISLCWFMIRKLRRNEETRAYRTTDEQFPNEESDPVDETGPADVSIRDEQLPSEESDPVEETGPADVSIRDEQLLSDESDPVEETGPADVRMRDEQLPSEESDPVEETGPADVSIRDEQLLSEESDPVEETGPADVRMEDEQLPREESDLEEETGPADFRPGEQTPLLDEEVTQNLMEDEKLLREEPDLEEETGPADVRPGEQTPLLDEEVTQNVNVTESRETETRDVPPTCEDSQMQPDTTVDFALHPSPATKKPTVHKKPQWFQKVCSHTQAREMLLTERNVDGSFLIRPSRRNPESQLFVRSGSEVYPFSINHTEEECWIEPEQRFENLQSLVNHYKQVKGCLPRTLVLPCVHQNSYEVINCVV